MVLQWLLRKDRRRSQASELTSSAEVLPLHPGLQYFKTVSPHSTFLSYSKIYFSFFFFFFSVERMRLPQGLLDNKNEERQVPWD